MPRANVIGWTLIACGVAMRIVLPRIAPPYDRVHSAMYAFYTFVVFVIGLSFVYFGMFGYSVSKVDRMEAAMTSERRGCLWLLCVAVILLWFAITLYESD